MAELGTRMSSTELNDWIAFAAIEPFGEEQADRRAALLAHTLVAVNTPKGKTPPSIDRFLEFLRPGHEAPAPSSEALKSGLAAAAQRGGRKRGNTREAPR